ncbi:MAG TPA: hypothetical protein VF525_07255 [Pyrinomonadaceae bacterium]|jgi:hypothetical protein
MTEAEQTQLSAESETEATLVTPRFDAVEAQTAQPVVPLAAVASRRRTWPLLLLSALLGGAVSICGLYLYQRGRADGATNAPQQQATTTTDAAHTEATEVAAQPARVPAAVPVSAATSDAVRTTAPPVEPAPVAAKRTPPSKVENARDTDKPARPTATTVEERTRRTEPAAAHRDASAPRGERVANERQPRSERPRTVQPRSTPPARNVDRIRDIFEGARPPL